MANAGLQPFCSRRVCSSMQNQRLFHHAPVRSQCALQAGPMQSAIVDFRLLSHFGPSRSPLFLPHRRSCCRSRLIPVRSEAASHAQQAGSQSDARPVTSLLFPGIAGLLLSKVVDGKGIMLATYWAARYFLPAIVSLWMAKQARKHWDSIPAMVVLAASYTASMAVSYRLLAGPTTTIKLYYPLFSGKVAIPRLVAKWIRHNNNLASLLTKMLAFGPWVLLSWAAARQLAVWLNASIANASIPEAGAIRRRRHSNAMASASGTSSLGPKKPERAGLKQEEVNGEAHQEDQNSINASSPIQATDGEADKNNDGVTTLGEKREDGVSHMAMQNAASSGFEAGHSLTAGLPTHSSGPGHLICDQVLEHEVRLETSRGDAVQEGKAKQRAEEENKAGRHDELLNGSAVADDLLDEYEKEEDSGEEVLDSSGEEGDSDEEPSSSLDEEDPTSGKDDIRDVDVIATELMELLDMLSKEIAKSSEPWQSCTDVPEATPNLASPQELDNINDKLQEQLRDSNSMRTKLLELSRSTNKEAKIDELLREIDQLTQKQLMGVKDHHDSHAEEVVETSSSAVAHCSSETEETSAEKLGEAQQEGQTEVEQLKQKHEDEVFDLQQEHEEEVQKLEYKHEEEVMDLEMELEDEVRELEYKHDEEVEELEQDHEEEVEKMEQEHEDQVEDLDNKHEDEVDKLEHEHEDELEQLEGELEDRLEGKSEAQVQRLEQKHENQVEKLEQKHESQVEKLDQKHEKQVEKLEQEHEDQVEKLEQKHKDQVEKLEQEHDKEVEKLEQKHANQVKKLEQGHEEQVDKLEQKHVNEVEELKQKHIEELGATGSSDKEHDSGNEQDQLPQEEVNRSGAVPVDQTAELSVEMANLSDRLHEMKQLDGEHTREVDKQAQDIKEVQHKHTDAVAELKQPAAEDMREYQGQGVELESHVAQLVRDLKSLQTRTVSRTEMQQLQAALDVPEKAEKRIGTPGSPELSIWPPQYQLVRIPEGSSLKAYIQSLKDEKKHLQEKIKEASNKVAHLIELSPAMDAEMTELLHKVDQLKQQDAPFEEKCRRAQFDHKIKVYQLKQGHGNEVKALEREHEDKVEKLERKHAHELADQDVAHQCAMGAFDENPDSNEKQDELQQKLWEATQGEANLSVTCAKLRAELAAKVSEHFEKLNQLKNEHALKLEDVEESHAQAVRQARWEHEDEVTVLRREKSEDERGYQDQLTELESEVVQLDRELKGLQTQNANLQQLQAAHEEVLRHVLIIYNQDRGYDGGRLPGKFWKAIDEMKGAYLAKDSDFQVDPVTPERPLHGDVTGSRKMTQDPDKWAKIHELDAEIKGLKEVMCKQASKMEEAKDSHSEELKQMQLGHEHEVAELKSQLVQLEQDASGLQKLEADKGRQAAQQVEGGEQEVAATQQVKQLQAQLRMQAKSYQLVQEAFAIEEKCKRDELQAQVDKLQATPPEHSLSTASPDKPLQIGKDPRILAMLSHDSGQQSSRRKAHHRARAVLAKPNTAAANGVLAVESDTEAPPAAAAATVLGSPVAAVQLSDDEDVQVSVEPAATVQPHDRATSTTIQVPDGSSGIRNGKVDEAPTTQVQTAGGAPAVMVQISEVEEGMSEGEVQVDIVSATPSWKPAKSASSAVEVSDGKKDEAGGSVKVDVDVAAVTGAQSARAGSQASKVANWLVGDSKQALPGNKVDAGKASGNKAGNPNQMAVGSGPSGAGSDVDGESVVQVTVDRSLLR